MSSQQQQQQQQQHETPSKYRSEQFLISHIHDCMRFYTNSLDSSDENAGFFHCFNDSGTVIDQTYRHLVSSTRFVFTNAMAYQEFGEGHFKVAVEHGIRHVRNKHRNVVTGGYCWTLQDGVVADSTYHCYGMAFVLLAYAKAFSIGVAETRSYMEETWELLEARYWEESAGLYRDEANRDWKFSQYRGQNANMHMCEALLAAYRACGDIKYLNRALLLAQHMTQRQAQLTGTPFVWEHYHQSWDVDWQYNLDDPKHTFRPWGFQPGHQIQWAKLCLLLYQQDPSAHWLKSTAVALFDCTMKIAWDEVNKGIVYGFSTEIDSITGTHKICDDDKYFWVQAEAIAASALLAQATGEARYWKWYEELWGYADTHFVDHQYGAWFCILDCHNQKYSSTKSPAGKTDYHSMGACHDVLAVLRSYL